MLLAAVAVAALWFAVRQNRAASNVSAAAEFADLNAAHRMPQQESSPLADQDPRTIPTFFEMSDPAVNSMIVKDIDVTPADARWTFVKPTLRFLLGGSEGQRFAMDFAIAGATFQTTGPVTLSISINGHLLGTLRCEHPGDFHFEKAVPAEWLAGTDSALVEAALDKLWTAPADHAQLGYLLIRAGFLH